MCQDIDFQKSLYDNLKFLIPTDLPEVTKILKLCFKTIPVPSDLGQLSALSRIAMEREVIKKLEKHNPFDLVIETFAKCKDRRIDFLIE